MANNMGTSVVFYSWQSDLPNKTNRGLIREALEGACKDLSADLESAPRVDSDIQGESGSPDIAATILDKIDKAAVVVADVSIIGLANVVGSSPRPVPNPNVMLELGYAKKALGTKRVIMVCNTAFGRIEDLPFDIRGKSVVAYSFKDDGEKPAQSRNDLRAKLGVILKDALYTFHSTSKHLDPLIEQQEQQRQRDSFQRLRESRLKEARTNPPDSLITTGPIMLLQIVPVSSLDEQVQVDLRVVPDLLVAEMAPYGASGWDYIYHEDSVTSITDRFPPRSLGYTKVFESGAMQYAAIISNSSPAILNSIVDISIKAIHLMVPALEKLSLAGKFFVSIDLVRASGAQFTVPSS